jgi:hypothetical protein
MPIGAANKRPRLRQRALGSRPWPDRQGNLRKSKTARRINRSNTPDLDLQSLIRDLAKDANIASRGLQGVHAEVMRRVASGKENAFVDYADVRRVWESIVKEPHPNADRSVRRAKIAASRKA